MRNVCVARSLSMSSRLSRGLVLIDDDRRQVVHGLVDEAEEHELEQRDGQRDHQRPAVAQDVQELLAEDGDERVPHGQAPLACGAREPRRRRPQLGADTGSPRARASCSVSVTKTSSSDGAICAELRVREARRAQRVEEGLVGPRRVDDGVHGLPEDGRVVAERLLLQPRQGARGPRRLDLEAPRVRAGSRRAAP